MAHSKKIKIEESIVEIKALIKKSSSIISKRLRVLLEFKKHENQGISKRIVATTTGVNHNSVQNWRDLYVNGGIEALMSHNNTGYKPNKINSQQELAIEEVVNNSENGFVGYAEMQNWFNEKYNQNIEYNTFRTFLIRKFKTKIKVARKYHAKKDPEAVDTFKKTSRASVSKSSVKKPRITKK